MSALSGGPIAALLRVLGYPVGRRSGLAAGFRRCPAILEFPADEAGLAQPKHWSGRFSAIREWRSVTGSSVNSPPPCTKMPGLPVSELRITSRVIQRELNRRAGNVGAVPYPCALRHTCGPNRRPVLPMTLTPRRSRRLSFKIPAPWLVADPVEVLAMAVLSLMTPPLTVTSRASLLKRAPPGRHRRCPATPPGVTTVVVLPVMSVLLMVRRRRVQARCQRPRCRPWSPCWLDSLLPEMMLLRMVSGLSPTFMATSIPPASPRRSRVVTELPVIAVLSTVVRTSSPTWMPPEFASGR